MPRAHTRARARMVGHFAFYTVGINSYTVRGLFRIACSSRSRPPSRQSDLLRLSTNGGARVGRQLRPNPGGTDVVGGLRAKAHRATAVDVARRRLTTTAPSVSWRRDFRFLSHSPTLRLPFFAGAHPPLPGAVAGRTATFGRLAMQLVTGSGGWQTNSPQFEESGSARPIGRLSTYDGLIDRSLPAAAAASFVAAHVVAMQLGTRAPRLSWQRLCRTGVEFLRCRWWCSDDENRNRKYSAFRRFCNRCFVNAASFDALAEDSAPSYKL